MKQGTTFLASARLILYREGFWGEPVTACWEIGTWTKYMRLVHSFCVEGYQKSQQILMVPSMFLMLPHMAFRGALLRVWQLQWFGVNAVQCVGRGNCQKESRAHCSLRQGQMKAYITSVVSLLTQQPRALQEAHKTSCHFAKENRRTASGCWHTLHHAEYSEYSNKSCARTQTANVLFVVFYSYEQESPCSDFSLKSCDGKSVSQDIGSVSELVDHIDVAECSGNTHYGMLFGDIQSKCVGQIHKLTCGFRSSSTRGSTGITTTHLCHKLLAQS